MEENLENMDDDDFTEATDKGYNYLSVNGNIMKAVNGQGNWEEKMVRVKEVVAGFKKGKKGEKGESAVEEQRRK